MDKDTIIRLARKAGGLDPAADLQGAFVVTTEFVEHFAALVLANTPPQSWMSYQEGYEAGQQAGRLAERERICKQIAMLHDSLSLTGAAIRSRT